MEENKRLSTQSEYCPRCACVGCMTSAISWPNGVITVARIAAFLLESSNNLPRCRTNNFGCLLWNNFLLCTESIIENERCVMCAEMIWVDTATPRPTCRQRRLRRSSWGKTHSSACCGWCCGTVLAGPSGRRFVSWICAPPVHFKI